MASLSRFSVRRPVTTLMVTLILIGFGLYGLTQLRLNLYPDVSFPTVTVYTTYEGVAPEDMETLVTRPIEESVGSVSGIERVRSLSSQGASVVRLHFQWGTDLFEAETEVRKQLDMIRRSLPQEVEAPIVFSYDPNDEPVVVLTLTSDIRSPRDLRTLATQQLEQRLERVEGVASATTSGGYDRQINVRISNTRMRAYNLDIAQVANRLRQDNIQVPAGELREGEFTYSLRTVNEFQDIRQIRETIVGSQAGTPVYLGDIAEVEDGISQPIGNVRIDGQDGVILNVYRQSDSNVVMAAQGVVEAVDEMHQMLPEDVRLSVLSNQADFIRLSIRNLIQTGGQAIILVIAMLLLFLRSGRPALIVAVSIPVSIVTTFSIMFWADVSINIISLSGLTLAVGMVVDNAVVVLENIFRYREDGSDGPTAAVDGANEVMTPVVMSTMTTAVVFLPILFVPGIAGLLFRDLALTVTFALIVSVLVSLTVIPVLASRLFERPKESPNRWLAMKSVQERLRRIGSRIGEWLDRLETFYSSLLERVLPYSGRITIAAFLFLLATLPIVQLLDGEFFPVVDEGRVALEVEREPGVTLFELERSIQEAEEVIRQEGSDVRLMVSDYGDKPGIEGADHPGGNRGVIRLELTPAADREQHQVEITASLIESLQVIPGLDVRELREDPLSPDGETGLQLRIYGYDPVERMELANRVVGGLREMEGVAGVYTSMDEGRPELRLQMDRERIARVGMTTSDVANVVGRAIRGEVATSFVDQGIEFDVLVQLDPVDRANSGRLEEIQIQTPEAGWMPLSNLARIERVTGPSTIHRVNQERVVEVGADLGNLDLSRASEQVRDLLDQMEWPEGYRYEIGGSAEDQQASFAYLLIAFLVAGVLTYMVMASQFESLMEPLIIIVTIPLALSGVLIGLWSTGTAISVTAMVGLVLLTGIVVNNGIVMIDYIKILRVRGLDRDEAIQSGATRRLRPILMTALTTILAMVPLALELGAGSETWSPMARTVIGGLTMSTLLMLLVVPCMYRLVSHWSESFGFQSVSRKTDPVQREVER
ncbi:MAG: efflux RND transporter permease subunit [Bacteroidota bacterium]